MVKLLCIWLCLPAIWASDLNSEDLSGRIEFEKYKLVFNKNYSNGTEDNSKFVKWQKNMDKIIRHNFEEDAGLHSFRLGQNSFTDMSHKEFVEQMTRKLRNETSPFNNVLSLRQSRDPVPDEWDWRTKNVVGPVRDQGQCGSASLFGSLGSLESMLAIKIGTILPLSGQQLLECCGDVCACTGGASPELYYKCIRNIGGLDSERCYPYNNTCQQCHSKPQCISVKCQGYATLAKGDEIDLKNALYLSGPIATGIDASQTSFQLYSSGIYEDPFCNQDLLDHVVLLVGYGTENGQDYWIAKNSWGANWGDHGYFRIARNKGNMCGIATMASYPII